MLMSLVILNLNTTVSTPPPPPEILLHVSLKLETKIAGKGYEIISD